MAGGQKTGDRVGPVRPAKGLLRMEGDKTGRYVYPSILAQGRRHFERTYGEETKNKEKI